MRISDMSAVNFMANVRGVCAYFESVCWYSSFYVKQFRIMISQWVIVFNHLATNCILLPATIQDFRFGITLYCHAKYRSLIEVRG